MVPLGCNEDAGIYDVFLHAAASVFRATLIPKRKLEDQDIIFLQSEDTVKI